jgi:hypothetical protein
VTPDLAASYEHNHFIDGTSYGAHVLGVDASVGFYDGSILNNRIKRLNTPVDLDQHPRSDTPTIGPYELEDDSDAY